MKEGDAYNAANTNAEIDDLVTDINDLTFADNVRLRSLGPQHLPSIMSVDDGVDVNRGDGMNVGSPSSDWPGSVLSSIAFDNYKNALSPDTSGAATWPKDIQVFDSSPIGATGGTDVGWRIVASSSAIADSCSVVWGAGGTTWSDYDSVLISASVCIGHNETGYISGGELFTLDHWKNCFALAFAIEDTAGNRYCVPRTVRCFQAITSVGERVSLTALLKASDLTAAAASHGGNANARRVSLIFGRFIPDKTTVEKLANKGSVQLGPFNITQTPMHHGTLS